MQQSKNIEIGDDVAVSADKSFSRASATLGVVIGEYHKTERHDQWDFLWFHKWVDITTRYLIVRSSRTSEVFIAASDYVFPVDKRFVPETPDSEAK